MYTFRRTSGGRQVDFRRASGAGIEEFMGTEKVQREHSGGLEVRVGWGELAAGHIC
jgi:hypothetical protein